jgi:DNA polymerase I-like protein with 3'-5' exonuclease and polymerase domains
MAKTIWQSLMSGEPTTITNAGKPSSRKIDGVVTGCDECELNECKSRKFLDTTTLTVDKPELWLPHPGLSGVPQADWSHLAKVMSDYGIPFNLFDVHYSVKCAPTMSSEGFTILSKTQEAHYNSCATYTQNIAAKQAQRRSNESIIVLFGYNAGKQHSPGVYRMDAPVFWNENLNATVYVLPMPNKPTLRGTGEHSPEFFRLLSALSWHVVNPGRYSFLHSLDVRPLYTAEEFQEYVEWLRSTGRRVTLDIEDDGQGRLLCIGFSITDEYAHVLVLDHPENPYWESEKDAIWQLLYEVLADETIDKTFQFGAYDVIELMDRYRFLIRGYKFDTLLGSYLRESFNRKHGLEAIAQRAFPQFAGYKSIVSQYYAKSDGTDEEAAASDRGFVGLAQCPLDILIQYNGGDVILTHKADVLYSQDVPMPLMRCYIGASIALRRAEENGVYVDIEHSKLVAHTSQLSLLNIRQDLVQLTKDTTFNPGSSPDVKKYMFDVFKLPRLGDIDEDMDNEEDRDATDANALTRIAHATEHPFPEAILEYRSVSKQEQYALKFQESASFYNGQARTRFMVAGAASGRLRSSGEKDKATGLTRKLNLQNVPRSAFVKNCLCSAPDWRKLLGHAEPVWKILRKGPRPHNDPNTPEYAAYQAFLADASVSLRKSLKVPKWLLALKVLLIADLGGAESRVIAWLSGDEKLKSIFRSGKDIHASVGEMMGLGKYEDIKRNKKLRTRIKNLGFGMNYGLTDIGLFYYMKPMTPDITQPEVSALHAQYFETFGAIKRFIDQQHSLYKRDGGVGTPWGFWRHINAKVVKTTLDNVAVNSPVQNIAHQLMLCSLAVLTEQPEAYSHLITAQDSGLSLEVHDAFYNKVTLEHLVAGRDQLVHLMEHANVQYSKDVFNVDIDIPIVAEASYGYTMGTEADFPTSTDPGDLVLHWLLKYWEGEYFQALEYGYQNRLL